MGLPEELEVVDLGYGLQLRRVLVRQCLYSFVDRLSQQKLNEVLRHRAAAPDHPMVYFPQIVGEVVLGEQDELAALFDSWHYRGGRPVFQKATPNGFSSRDVDGNGRSLDRNIGN